MEQPNPQRKWIKRIQAEWEILEKNIPSKVKLIFLTSKNMIQSRHIVPKPKS